VLAKGEQPAAGRRPVRGGRPWPRLRRAPAPRPAARPEAGAPAPRGEARPKSAAPRGRARKSEATRSPPRPRRHLPRAQETGAQARREEVDRRQQRCFNQLEQVPEAAEGPQLWRRDARQQGVVRRVRPEGDTRGRLTARQIEAARRAMTRHIKRGGRIWIRIFPDKPVSHKPPRSAWATQGQPRVLRGRDPARQGALRDGRGGPDARQEAFALAAAKLPIRTIVVQRHLGNRMKPSDLRARTRRRSTRNCRISCARSSACACRRPRSS